MVEGLRGLGADIEATEDGFAVRGTGGLRGGAIEAHGDHRLAMLGAVAGLASREGVEVRGMEAAAVSYPGFVEDLERLLIVGTSAATAVDRRPAAAGGERARRDRRSRRAPASRPSPGRSARELGFTYLDSGAMYRCVALLVAASAPGAVAGGSWPARHGSSWARACCSTGAT